MADSVDNLTHSARSKGTGCHWRAVGHDYAYRRYKAVLDSLAALVAIASAIAGSALLGTAGDGWAIAAGAIGLLGAVLAAVQRGFDLSPRAEENREAAGAFRAIRNRYWDFAGDPPSDPAAARARLDEIRAEHDALEERAIPLDGWADDKATAGYKAAMGRLKADREGEEEGG